MELKIQGVTKYYGTRAALQNVTLGLMPGIIAVMGPNGSGKTTLLRCLASLVQPERGQLWFDGLDYRRNATSLRSRIGYLPQELDMPSHLTPRQLLAYLATLKNTPMDHAVYPLLDALGLETIADIPFSRLSGGQIRLVGIAQAFLGQPDLLLLDELTRGLDVEERARVFALVRKPAPGRLLLYSTHHPADAEQAADGVIILRQGRVLFSGEVAKLYQQAQTIGSSLVTPIQENNPRSKRISQENDASGSMEARLIYPSVSDSPDSTIGLTIEEAYLRLLQKPDNEAGNRVRCKLASR